MWYIKEKNSVGKYTVTKAGARLLPDYLTTSLYNATLVMNQRNNKLS